MAEMNNLNCYRTGFARAYPSMRTKSQCHRYTLTLPTLTDTNSSSSSNSTISSSVTGGEERYHPTKILTRNVKNLSRQEIHKFFSKFGPVATVEKWHKSNTALVRFETASVASTVLQAPLSELLYCGRQLVVEKRLLPKLHRPSDEIPSVVDYTCSIADVTMSIHCLPDEILEHIFTYLTPKERIRTELVCKYWRSMGKDIPWRNPVRLDLDSENKAEYDPLTDKMVQSIVSRCGLTLKNLTLARRFSIDDVILRKAVEVVCRYCPNLVQLKLAAIPVSNMDLKSLAAKAEKLKRLTIHHSDFTEEALSKFLQHCETLEYLDICDNYNISGQCFGSVGKNFKALRVTECFGLDNACARILASKCNHLQELRLPHCNRVDADVIVQIVHKYRQTLKVLQLDSYIRDMDWPACLKILHNLEDLSLDECSKVDDKLLGVLVKSCPKLRALNVGATSVTDEGLYSLASAPCLKLLDISYTDQILGDGVEALASQGKLEEVFIRSNLEVSDEMCHSFAEFCSNLRLLDVSDAPEITNTLVSSFRASIEQGILRGPVKLVVGGTGITEDAQTCERLELVFENTSRREFCSDIDDYTDDDSDFDYYSYNSGYDSYYDYDSDALGDPFDEPFLFIWS